MARDRLSTSIDPVAFLAALDQGPRTFHELREGLGATPASVRRVVRELHASGQLFVRGDLVARCTYYLREADGFGLGVIHCGGLGAERRSAHQPSDDTGDAA